MSLDLFFTFAAATALLILIPGPTVTMLIATSIAHGTRSGLVTLAGSSSAIAAQLIVVAIGMTSVLHLLAEWFEWLRWLGVAYLIWLGLQHWLAKPVAEEDGAEPAISDRRLFWRGFFISATNPKSLLFYAAFFPQFIDPAAPAGLQVGILCATFLTIAMTFDCTYTLMAGRARRLLLDPSRARMRNRITGTILIGTGIWIALVRRA